jgi:GAF domain-containing protein
MLRDGRVLGVINVARREPGSFSDREITLLQTFADQAVIAIENVRLFKELQTSNRDLTAALEQQDGDQRDFASDHARDDRHAAGVRHDRAQRGHALPRDRDGDFPDRRPDGVRASQLR